MRECRISRHGWVSVHLFGEANFVDWPSVASENLFPSHWSKNGCSPHRIKIFSVVSNKVKNKKSFFDCSKQIRFFRWKRREAVFLCFSLGKPPTSFRTGWPVVISSAFCSVSTGHQFYTYRGQSNGSQCSMFAGNSEARSMVLGFTARIRTAGGTNSFFDNSICRQLQIEIKPVLVGTPSARKFLGRIKNVPVGQAD